MNEVESYDLVKRFSKLVDASTHALCSVHYKNRDDLWIRFRNSEIRANELKYWNCSLLMYICLDRNL